MLKATNTMMTVRPRILRDLVMQCIAWIAASLVAGAFGWLLFDLVWHGASRLDWSFLTTAPKSAGRLGGIAPILVSTVLILAVAIVVAAPVGLATAILLSEFTRSYSLAGRWIGLSLDVLAGVPSIVFGLFGNAFFSVWMGLGFSILSGGLTLACMVLPILIRTAESGLLTRPTRRIHLGMQRSRI